MKRFCIFMLVLSLVLVTGCSSKGADATEPSQDTPQQVTQNTESENETENQLQTDLNEGNNEKAEEMIVRITVGEQSFTAKLYDNEATRALWDMLPKTFPMMNLYGREMCYRMGNGALPDDTAEDIGYKVGDISYWPPAGSLVILYKQNGEVFEQVKIGHTDDDISFFDGMEDTEITFEKAE